MPNGRWGRWVNHLSHSIFRAFLNTQEDGWKIIFRSKVSALGHSHFNCPKDFSCLSFSARCWKCTDCKPDFVAFAINSLGVQEMSDKNLNLLLNKNCTLSKMWQRKDTAKWCKCIRMWYTAKWRHHFGNTKNVGVIFGSLHWKHLTTQPEDNINLTNKTAVYWPVNFQSLKRPEDSLAFWDQRFRKF